MSFSSIARTYTLLDGVQLLLRRPSPPLTIFSTQLTTGNPRSQTSIRIGRREPFD